MMLFLSIVLLLALVLRLWFVHQVEPFVDEHISMLAIRSIIRYGVPRLPSGLLYAPKGLLHSYIGALSHLTLGPTLFSLRIPSVMAGMLTICCLYRAGRNWFSPGVGVLAAVALATSPSAVEWSGRVRMYAPLQLFSVIGVYMLVNGYTSGGRHRTRILGVMAMVLAILSHTLALIMLGSVVVGLVLSQWTRPELRRRLAMPSIAELGAWCLLIAVIAFLHPAKGVWGFGGRLSDLVTGTLSAASIKDRLLHLIAFTHQFAMPPLWPFTLVYVIGFLTLILRWLRGMTIDGDPIAWMLYIMGFCAWVTTSLLTQLHDDRYLFAALPFYFLLVARETQLLLGTIATSIKTVRIRPFVPVVLGSVLIAVLTVPATLRSANDKNRGYLAAFAHIRENWKSEDVVATEATATSLVLLDRADYYVRQYGAEATEGRSVVTGAPLISTADQLITLSLDHPRVWFVVEDLAWARHFDRAFREIVLNSMELAYQTDRTFVFISSEDG
jgi:4-amino-4-deoxy-L-arabinose transferase-like glycosyltransferase